MGCSLFASSTRIRFAFSLQFLRAATPLVGFVTEEVPGMQVDPDGQEIIERVAALDIGKAEVVCCVRVPGPGGRRMQEVRTFTTMTRSLLGLSDWLAGLGVTRVVMEATSDYVETAVLLVGEHVSDVAGQRQGRQTPPWKAQNRSA